MEKCFIREKNYFIFKNSEKMIELLSVNIVNIGIYFIVIFLF